MLAALSKCVFLFPASLEHVLLRDLGIQTGCVLLECDFASGHCGFEHVQGARLHGLALAETDGRVVMVGFALQKFEVLALAFGVDLLGGGVKNC